MPDDLVIAAAPPVTGLPQAVLPPFSNARSGVNVVHIRYFLAVCEVRNFTLAAKHCGVSQPTLSAAMRRLERQLGGNLFRRERNPRVQVQPTPLALKLKPHFEAVVVSLDAAMNVATQGCV